jgi:mxaD protein
MKKYLAMLIVACLLPVTALAHGPSGQKVVKEVIINAPIEQVWAVLKDFGAIKDWHPNVSSVKLEEKLDEASEKKLLHRAIEMKDGTTLVEKLREVDDVNLKLDYKMNDGPESTFLVSGYRTVMQLEAEGEKGTKLTWTARFYNKANSLESPPGLGNKEANAAINAFYDAGAEGLQKHFK